MNNDEFYIIFMANETGMERVLFLSSKLPNTVKISLSFSSSPVHKKEYTLDTQGITT